LPKREGVVEAGVLRIGDSYRGRRNDNINTYAVVEAAGAPKAGFADYDRACDIGPAS
jgi:hypothetical protein